MALHGGHAYIVATVSCLVWILSKLHASASAALSRGREKVAIISGCHTCLQMKDRHPIMQPADLRLAGPEMAGTYELAETGTKIALSDQMSDREWPASYCTLAIRSNGLRR